MRPPTTHHLLGRIVCPFFSEYSEKCCLSVSESSVIWLSGGTFMHSCNWSIVLLCTSSPSLKRLHIFQRKITDLTQLTIPEKIMCVVQTGQDLDHLCIFFLITVNFTYGSYRETYREIWDKGSLTFLGMNYKNINMFGYWICLFTIESSYPIIEFLYLYVLQIYRYGDLWP